jgi:proline iminopeptidase
VAERVVDLPDGAALWTTTSGSGPPVVLLHGGPGLWDYLAPVAALLEDRHTVVRLDQRGCGRSSGEGGPFTVAQAVADLDVARAHLGHDRWSVVGHSWGAELALRYAATHPDRVERVVYLAGVGPGEGFRARFEPEVRARLGERLARVTELRGRDRTPDEERELCLLEWEPDFAPGPDARRHTEAFWQQRPTGVQVNEAAHRALWADRASEDLLEVAARVRAPVTMLFGAEDPRPWDASDPLRAALPHVVDHVVLGGAGHSPWHEQPARTRQVLRDALA